MPAISPQRTTPRGARTKLAITVLRGGPSREREVSLHSGEEIAVALESLGHSVIRADIGPNQLDALDQDADCVFIALHGTFGEDGTIQAILESRGIAYTGCGPESCALAMNKVRTKERLLQLGLPTPAFKVVTPENLLDAATWTLPVVVKPVSEGSSILCTIVRNVTEFRPAVEAVVKEYGEALVEEFIPGLELTVGILGDTALPAIEIRTKSEFYDYHAKYQADDTEYRFDIPLPAEMLKQISEMSLAAFHAIGGRDFARVDWRVDPHSNTAHILEINTIPGFTQHSLLPMAARRHGLAMPELCAKIVNMALDRQA